MNSNVRPESMERITNEALANAFIEQQVNELRTQIGDKKVLLALSGGVDSSVVAALLIKAVGQQLVCVHVNHGFTISISNNQCIIETDGQIRIVKLDFLCVKDINSSLCRCIRADCRRLHCNGHDNEGY